MPLPTHLLKELLKDLLKLSCMKLLQDMQSIELLLEFSIRHIQLQHERNNRKCSIQHNDRIRWSHIKIRLSDNQFKRMYRMSKGCFESLCEKIILAVGPDEFKSEEYLDQVYKECEDHYLIAHQIRNNGLVCGEIKLAVTLRLLAGASYLDLLLLYGISYQHIYTIFHYVNKEWICHNDVTNISFHNDLQDENSMEATAKQFANGTSHGIISGCIGAVDGWLVRIKCPSHSRDGIKNPGAYYYRKGFYAFNIQIIADKNKMILWKSALHKGAQHDSPAFQTSNLYEQLQNKMEWLLEKKYYLIGDSAYSIRSFLLVPYDRSTPGSKEDGFNYHLSACRIYVECTFGALYNRWGILWRPLLFSLQHNVVVIDSVCRLHNFIIKYEMDHNIDPDETVNIFGKEIINNLNSSKSN